jgi:PadR family transcriptional regulator PadR
MTVQTRRVLAEFLKDHDAELYGVQIRKATGLHPGTIYPILERLEGAGLLASRWEPRPSGIYPGRPPRHYYCLTSEGWAVARQEAARARSCM